MPRFERGFHPLSAVEGHDVPKLAVDLGLPPYVDTGQIGVNVRRIHAMMRLGGISNLKVVGTAGETSSFTPTVVGHSPDGSAFAGKTGVAKKVPTFSVDRELSDSNSPPFIAGRWTDATVAVNLSEMQDRIAQSEQPVRSPKAWGGLLNEAIGEGIAKAGVEHVVFDTNILPDRFQFVWNTGFGTTMGLGQFGFASDMSPVEGIVSENLFFHGLGNVINRYHYRVGGYDTERFRWSVFSGPQFDRACALKALARAGRVVKALPSSQ